MILLDTHLLVWLYAGLTDRIPTPVRERLRVEQLALSPFVELELAYLCQVGRIRDPLEGVLGHLTTRLEMVVADVSAAAVCTVALPLSWTRDPFDRLLSGHAIVANVPLITKDATMRANLLQAWWEEG